jgi:hypothetical protein
MERDAGDDMADTEPKLERGLEVHFYHYPPAAPCSDWVTRGRAVPQRRFLTHDTDPG